MTTPVTDYTGGIAGIKAAEARRLEMLTTVKAAIDQFGRLRNEVGIGLDQMPAEMETARRALWEAHNKLEAMERRVGQFVSVCTAGGHTVCLRTMQCEIPIACFVGPSADRQAQNLRNALNVVADGHVNAYEGAIRL